MTVYELAVSVPEGKRAELTAAGLMPATVERYVYVYRAVRERLAAGDSKMDAYETVSQKCYTSVENVRKIVRKMEEQISIAGTVS